MRIVVGLAVASLMGWGEEFMSPVEYGQMLYHQPRGVSCSACHGKHGEGKLIATYKDKQKQTVQIKGPDIRGISVEKLSKALQNTKSLIMPTYYLTREEIEAIALYLRSASKEGL